MSLSGNEEVDKELTDIDEHEPANYDSDGLARSRSLSPGMRRDSIGGGSVGSGGGGSTGSSGRAKRRTWKKPKDKPKRPLSAYNIFFKHERSRIVEGKTEEATPEETIRSIEIILSTSRETRRHRKTHGRISFGDLARRIADKWKGISQEHKSLFEHYAELDMRRYRKEVQNWKDRKEAEALQGKAGTSSQEGSAQSGSFSDSISDYSEGAGSGVHDPWAPRKSFYDNLNNSFSSVESEVSFDQLPVRLQLQMMQQQQQRQLQMHAQMTNSGLNLHSSMPNLRCRNSDGGGGRSFFQSSGGFGGGGNFGQSFEQELFPSEICGSSANNVNMMMGLQQNQRLNLGMNALHSSFSGGRPNGFTIMGNDIQRSVPFTIGDEQMSGNFQQLQPNSIGFGDNPFADQKPKADPAFSFHDVAGPESNLDPVPFDQVFPDERGDDLGNYLCDLDLSNT
ncbi:HMG high mobility group box-containing protein [Nitzschia inconspicua]|uniref:HMG high mobility group box-containing protein n=1 Tax=Nitzschia inconspicua TaxID=303405 RepID=A0A9K3KW44_9STRA|nr:HMG high mobility group box-containing protein [Nitzschia inconspicua]